MSFAVGTARGRAFSYNKGSMSMQTSIGVLSSGKLPAV